MQRVRQLAAHLAGPSTGVDALTRKSPDDVVITMAIRSALCKAKKGGFKDARYVLCTISFGELYISLYCPEPMN
jgi:hypothetical protein